MKKYIFIAVVLLIIGYLYLGSMPCTLEKSPLQVYQTKRIMKALQEKTPSKIVRLIAINKYMGEVYYSTNNELKDKYIKNLNNFLDNNDFRIIEVVSITDMTDDCFSRIEVEAIVSINGENYNLIFGFGGAGKLSPSRAIFINDDVDIEIKKILEKFNEVFSTYYAG